MHQISNRVVIGSLAALAALFSCTSEPESVQPSPYSFTEIKNVACTEVKDQGKTSTCWCYSAIAQIESELMLSGKGETDLSEMFVVRHSYYEKAVRFARMNGNSVISQRGEPTDTYDIIDKYGIVPEKFYPDLCKYSRGEIDRAVNDYMETVLSEKPLSPEWQNGLNTLLDKYFGQIPAAVEGFTPKEYADSLGISRSDFVCVTSFTHHPFYRSFVIELPDNWACIEAENIPLDKMMALIDSTLESGHTVLWGADISEPGFKSRKGYAIISDSIEIDQNLRQTLFDNHSTTDDHDMLITGYAQDQNGNRFYKVKNSYGAKGPYKGYFYASRQYVAAKTILIMVPIFQTR